MIDLPDYAPEFLAFEPLDGKTPMSVLDVHPGGRHVALQIPPPGYVERAGVWDIETRALVWAPESVSALAWFPGGDEIACTAELFTPAPESAASS